MPHPALIYVHICAGAVDGQRQLKGVETAVDMIFGSAAATIAAFGFKVRCGPYPQIARLGQHDQQSCSGYSPAVDLFTVGYGQIASLEDGGGGA